jgi:FtsX-like permease family
MSLLAKLRSFLRNLFSSQSVDADLDREVHSHLSMLIDENIRAGMPPDEAQRAAHMELGGIEQVKEQVREKRIGNWLHSAFSDCHYGVRQLRKNPGFTAVAILTLALGIGATTAIFSVVDVVILRPRPYNSPDRLVLVKERIPKVTPDPIPVCAPDVLHFQREKHSFVSLAAFRGDQFDLAGGTGTAAPAASKDPWLTGVGVVGDVKQSRLDMETSPHTYESFWQNTTPSLNVALRTSNDPASMASALRSTVWSIDPQLAVAQIQIMDLVISKSTTPRRFSLFLLAGFASLALILSAIGIYGVIAYSVVRRVHEMGIRIALGAQRRNVMRVVISQGMLLLAVGTVIGTLGALAMTRTLASFFYGVRPTDPVTFVAVVVILAGVAFLACYIPARRATRVDPMIALRYE